MRRTIAAAAACALALGGGGAGWAHARDVRVRAEQATASAIAAAATRAAEEERARDLDLAFYEARVKADPFSALDVGKLASLHARRARETGDWEDYLRAEKEARTSLELRAQRNGQGFSTLAGALMAQHRFVEARQVAERYVAQDPASPSARGLLAEIELELGQYEEVRPLFGSLQADARNLAVAPRLARWAEINGRTNEAREILYRASHDAEARGDMPLEQVAWFHLRTGDLELRAGRLDAAERAYGLGLRAHPGDARLLDGMARLAAARGQWEQALAYGEQGLAKVLDPATLALMSEVALARGDAAKAEEYAKVMQVSVARQKGSYHRAWALFLLDHGQEVAPVAAQARGDIATRRDVYGWDLLAWTLHRQGRGAEARQAMGQALRMGTEDAQLFYHAGAIARAAGDDGAAEAYLRRALRLNPGWHPTQPAAARAALDSIAAGQHAGPPPPAAGSRAR
ncbi:MAG TPA: tetratricopeptide repeat protein [Longimicrobiaceae bacterium]|nr:tetratricopeptide repeat protein [Longimicrobiaceae bacterium]